MDPSELTDEELRLAQYTIEFLPYGGPAESVWISHHENQGVVTGSEFEIEEGPGPDDHGGYFIREEVWKLDEEEVLEEAESRFTEES
ncbi:hypothetical protein [Natrinema caseinilyticum]|uniref:hypothetical protein n=1 Tax=Natrinema caseinilyticum TaxID=2961570 RepID=UPI0020C5409E|nr:hypothetical protein [Natrinema caseinilyticum]